MPRVRRGRNRFRGVVHPLLEKVCKCANRLELSRLWTIWWLSEELAKKRLDKTRKYLTVGKTAPKSTTPQKSVPAKSSNVSDSKPAANAEHPSANHKRQAN